MKKFLTIDDLIEFCMKNNFSKFSSKESNAEISVQMPAVATFGKSDDNKHTEGLCPFNATAYHDHVNLNKSNINEDTFQENTQSIPYRPILANIVENSDGNKDFGSHDFTVETDENGEEHKPTKESIILALQYLNKPFLENVYNSSVQAAERNAGIPGAKQNAWSTYIRTIAMQQYSGKQFKDSDFFKQKIIYEDEKTPADVIKGKEFQDNYEGFEKNKADVIRLIGYDPFEQEALSDQPFLYSQLIGLLDSSEDANDDMMRTASAISIVRAFLQQSKIDNAIATYMSDVQKLRTNSATIKTLQASKKDLTAIIKDLAAESCISLKNNKNAKKGENTWTGKIRKIKEMNLREGEVNGFDIGTCRGMRQVMDMSNASILKQLRLDESEYSDMLAEQREMITKLRDDLDNYKEISRILLRENIDLKDYMEEHNLIEPDNLVDLNELFSCFSSDEEETEVADDDESGSDSRASEA